MTRVAVMGSGSWGTAFGMVLADAGSDVTMWARESSLADVMNRDHVNPTYHPGIILPASLRATADVAQALEGAEIVVLAIPSQTLRDNLSAWRPLLPEGSTLVSLMKGIELGTTLRMSQVMAEVAQVGDDRVAVVSGPNLAREIAQRQPAATTVACADEMAAKRLQDACTTGYFRPYWTTDMIGTEIGGSVKNVIALANGMAVGMGFGENSQASLITRGLVEMTRLGIALGAEAETFLGLAGIGDLIATCSSSLSRNRTFGENLGRGLTVDETIAATKQTCEGVKSCQSILDLARKHGVDVPITEQVVNVVHHGMPPAHMLQAFMSRETKAEGID
ncbi:MAG: NAD(P)-dependent glycerol-3-phosphate dehydrogenase [Actinobacteria bacterium]|nr:NAD(P)-dependent glycerol-3-phosphate dehydrogenase [Actinomycetota bacterium]